MTKATPKPPETYQAFVKRYPKIGGAWEALAEAGKEGPLDDKTVRLVKLALTVGALREGAAVGQRQEIIVVAPGPAPDLVMDGQVPAG